jgi:hypothetical protein
MWWLDRTCYVLRPESLDDDVHTVLRRGGIPFILSRRDRPEAVLKTFGSEGTIYRLDMPATRPAGTN